jgi:hypothetical protein
MSSRKIILTLGPTAGDLFVNGSFVNGAWGFRQIVEGGETSTNIELVEVVGQSPAYTSKEVYTSSGTTYSAGSTVNNSIIDPSPAEPYRILEIIGPTPANDGSSWVVSFGGSNITEGPVVYNLIWSPSSIFGGGGANQAEAGDGYILIYDSLIGRWRIY